MIASMIRVQRGRLSLLDHTSGTPLALADRVVSEIGDDWTASAAELEVLDFKETPETAIPPEIRAKRNAGKARKDFLGLIAENAACFANAHGGVIVLGVRDAAPTRSEAIQGVSPDYAPEEIV